MERKASSVKIRTTGDLPSIPGEVTDDYPSLNNWWDDSVAVIDRLRDRTVIKTTLRIEGDAVGTLNEQEMVNKGLDSGTFI